MSTTQRHVLVATWLQCRITGTWGGSGAEPSDDQRDAADHGQKAGHADDEARYQRCLRQGRKCWIAARSASRHLFRRRSSLRAGTTTTRLDGTSPMPSSTDAIGGSGAICTQEFMDRRNPAGPVSLAATGPSAIARVPGLRGLTDRCGVPAAPTTWWVAASRSPPQNGEHFAASGLRWG